MTPPMVVLSGGDTENLRHEISSTELYSSVEVTNALKAEITDRRISAFTLPSHNFYYPNSHSTISDSYHDFALHAISISDLKDTIIPSRFTRGSTPEQAFKSQQYTSAFFQDCRGRVFPPDLYHAKSRLNETLVSGLSLVLHRGIALESLLGMAICTTTCSMNCQGSYRRSQCIAL